MPVKAQDESDDIKQFYTEFNAGLRLSEKAAEHFLGNKKTVRFRIVAHFFIEEDNSISRLSIVDDPGYGIKEEVNRILTLFAKENPDVMTRWRKKQPENGSKLPLYINIR